VPLHLQKCFADLGGSKGALPVAEAVADDCLALPIYPEVGEEAQREVVQAMREFYGA